MPQASLFPRLALIIVALLGAVVGLRGFSSAAESARSIPPPALDEPADAQAPSEVATLAGGCFWGVQGVFQHVEGVTSAVSGYAGGAFDTAHYEMVSSNTTGHAESVRVTFDPRRISYGRILQIYFSVAHDPTELNRQGPDVGTQYRSAIFPTDPEQARIAEAYIAQLNRDGEDGDDAAFRPNQIFAIALEHPVLDREYWEAVVTAVHAKLVTPVGLRSLAPGEPEYKPRYFGDVRARDAAYHQGTVWAWLIGPFIDAWLKVYPNDRAMARHFLDGFEPHLAEAGIGTISEVFDAEPPFTPRGCIAQAWSVAEVLRCLEKTTVERE